jgi:hypothetical protein
MSSRLLLASLVLASACPAALAEGVRSSQQSASRSYQIISAVQSSVGGQDSAMRRCRTYMDDATSAEKLGSRDMATKNWDRAARGCRADAINACKVMKSAAPEHCEGVHTAR